MSKEKLKNVRDEHTANAFNERMYTEAYAHVRKMEKAVNIIGIFALGYVIFLLFVIMTLAVLHFVSYLP